MPFERSIFHKTRQNQEESIDQYITSLCQQSAHCEYIEQDDQIPDHTYPQN